MDGKSLEQSALSIGVVKTVELDFNEIRELLAVLNQSDISELTLKSEDFELTVRKSLPVAYSVLAPEVAPAPEAAMVAPPAVIQPGLAA